MNVKQLSVRETQRSAEAERSSRSLGGEEGGTEVVC